MRIDERLNLVIPVDTAMSLGTIYVHSMPISREIFERYYLILAKTFSTIISEGLSLWTGPAVAMLALKDIARQRGELEGPGGVELGLIAEIHRLTNVALPRAGGGWEQIPYVDARSRGLIDEEDAGEVDNALAFFTLASSIARRGRDRESILSGMRSLWGAQTTSLSCTAFAASLSTSIETDDTNLIIPTMSSLPS